MHAAVREVAHRHRDPDRVDAVAGVLKSFALRTPLPDRKGVRWQPPTDVPGDARAAPTPATSSSTSSSCSPTSPTWPATSGSGIGIFVDEMQDISTDELAALCGACHEISQQGAPLVVVGAGLPHLPVALAASKSYAERLFRYVVVDRLPREMADRALLVPAGTEDVDYDPEALDELYLLTDGYPYFVQAYGKVTWDAALASPIQVSDVREAAPEAEGELAVGFFGARYDRATPAERDYMRAMADLAAAPRRRRGHHRRHRPGARPQAAEPLAGPRRADQEGPGVLQRARARSRSPCRTSASSCAASAAEQTA